MAECNVCCATWRQSLIKWMKLSRHPIEFRRLFHMPPAVSEPMTEPISFGQCFPTMRIFIFIVFFTESSKLKFLNSKVFGKCTCKKCTL